MRIFRRKVFFRRKIGKIFNIRNLMKHMDTSFVKNERNARFVKVIALSAVVIFVAALFVSLVGRNMNDRAWRQGGMMGNDWQGNRNGQFRTEVGYGMMDGVTAEPTTYQGIDGGAPVESSVGVTEKRVGMMAPDASLSASGIAADEDKKIVKTGTLAVKVENIEKTVQVLQNIAAQYGGEVISSSVYENDAVPPVSSARSEKMSIVTREKNGFVTLRVSADRFDEAMQSIRGSVRLVTNESINNQDATREFVDLEARLKNKQTEEAAIADILTRNTTKIDDVLRVTMELTRVRGEIEQLQMQMKYLDDQAALSTITVSMTEDAQIGTTGAKWRPSQEVKNALNMLLVAGQRIVNFLISFVIVMLPVLLLVGVVFGGLLYAIVKRLYRWLNNKS